MGGRKLIIRTLDIGSDKKADYFCLEPEENPALGFRAIRICFARPEIFMTQLRAICRAAAVGRVGVMFPMIFSLWELRKCKEFLSLAAGDLSKAGIPAGNVEVGISVLWLRLPPPC
jgi:phosphotransferase system enzyme I (PtsI)